jgi:hypothetical protein
VTTSTRAPAVVVSSGIVTVDQSPDISIKPLKIRISALIEYREIPVDIATFGRKRGHTRDTVSGDGAGWRV